MAVATRTTVPRHGGGATAEAKLALAEFLAICRDPDECAQRTLEWLGEHGELQQGLVARVDRRSARLFGSAGYDLPVDRVREFTFDLEQAQHPLIAALGASQPVVVDPHDDRAGEALAFMQRQLFLAVPLPLTSRLEERAGLLLMGVVSPEAARDARWAAEVLGQRLIQLHRLEELENASRALSRERALLHRVINAVPDPIVLTDVDGGMVVANARAEALLGGSAPKENESEGRRRAVALNNMLFSAALSQRMLEDGSEKRELPLVDPSEGSDLLFELISTTTGDREGQGIVSVLRNVTDLRRATEEIQANYRLLRMAEANVRADRDRLNLIIDSVADPILVTDPSGNIVLMNDPAERLFTPGEGAREDAQRAVRANDAQFSSFVSNVFLSGQSRWKGELNLVDPAGLEPVPFQGDAGKVVSEHGEVVAVVTILHDQSEALEKARLYEELKQASAGLEQKVREATAELVRQNELLQRQHLELEQASQLKSQFLANMSHEFRTPLNAILGYTSMLMKGIAGPLSDGQARYAERIDSNGKHLLGLINDILDISRIEAGKMPVHLGEVDIAGLVREVMQQAEPLIAQSRLQVRADIEKGLGNLHSDHQKVKQIVLNLLTNALKFTPRGSITVSVRKVGKQVEVAVKDTGIGIAPGDHERIFEDFRQADNSTTRPYGGAGLGLSICRRLAQMLGGTITLRSKLGEGSTFTLVLPRKATRK